MQEGLRVCDFGPEKEFPSHGSFEPHEVVADMQKLVEAGVACHSGKQIGVPEYRNRIIPQSRILMAPNRWCSSQDPPGKPRVSVGAVG